MPFFFIMNTEIWKDVQEFENYQISSFGRVKGKYGILKPQFDRNYYHVTLFKNGKRKIKFVHRLVAEAFIPNPNNLPQVNHIDGVKTNNNLSNLEWISCKGNALHAFRLGLRNPHDGGTSKKIDVYYKNGIFYKTFNSLHEIQRVLGVNIGNCWSVLNGQRKQIKGFIFKYHGK